MAEAGITLTQLTETKVEPDMVSAVQGEGTYEPRGFMFTVHPIPRQQ
jgi:hypothetical protein